jgi:hypothetical protein
MLYLWASAVSKISIVLALLRLAVRRPHRIILWSILTMVIIISLVFWLLLLLYCLPISYFWARVTSSASGTCLSTELLVVVAFIYSALTVICDIILTILPARLIWALQMRWRPKLTLGMVLSMGAMYGRSSKYSEHC